MGLWVIVTVTLLITPLKTTHEPSSRGVVIRVTMMFTTRVIMHKGSEGLESGFLEQLLQGLL